ncbi:MAG: ComF family protein [Spongiibacteraceae bacterium]|nr:ComF family protein [Spongiibacteraceae bacterium]
MVNNWLRRPWPCYCALCGGHAAGPLDLCDGCADELPWLLHPCMRCGVPLPAPSAVPCGGCLQRPPRFQHCFSPLCYQSPAAELVAALKFHGNLSAGNLLGELLAHHLREQPAATMVEALVPIPLHWRRRWQRGFNQSEVLADVVRRRLRLPVAHGLLRRSRHTTPQQQLDAAARARNLRQAFTVPRAVAGRHLALIDDVATTGATAEAAADALLIAGAASVQLWCVTRTPL